MFKNKSIVITGGTGSLGKTLLRRILSGEKGPPRKVIVFSRDEAKQHDLRLEYMQRKWATDEVIYHNFERALEFIIGDVRDYPAVGAALQGADMVIHAAALKQVPTCEYFPEEAVKTNVLGAQNIIRAIRELRLPIKKAICISTDKAVKPVNVMGMTKALQEKIFIRGNLDCPKTDLMVARYGNVLASRGSVIPLFHQQIREGGPVTVTDDRMTRFILSLDEAVDVVFAAIKEGRRGETFIPRAPTARVIDLAKTLIGQRKVKIRTVGIRPGEKLHEILVSEDEAPRTTKRGGHYVIAPILPELQAAKRGRAALKGEYSSHEDVITAKKLKAILKEKRLMVEDGLEEYGELLR